jgi:predicted helicase
LNKGEWIEKLMQAYKVSAELKKPAQAKWLSDDYVKFIRMSEHLISKNMGGGVLGFITNHGYLDNPTFLDMRRHLMETFDKIYVFDLHGNSKKKEEAPDGGADVNVFDIQQGVAIVIAVKLERASAERYVFHSDIWGSRMAKYNWLSSNSLTPSIANRITPTAPMWRWKPTDSLLEAKYRCGFSIADLFNPNGRHLALLPRTTNLPFLGPGWRLSQKWKSY